MKIGYARVSTDEQNLCLQLDALQATGCEIIFRDEGMFGASTKRPGLTDAMNALKPGDVLTVWRLDRLGRSLPHLIELLAKIGHAEAGFRSITEAIDTTTAGGKLVFHVIGAIAEFERSLISERTRAGMKAARRRGKAVGRPAALSPEKLDLARHLVAEGKGRTIIARMIGVGPATLRRKLNAPGPEQ